MITCLIDNKLFCKGSSINMSCNQFNFNAMHSTIENIKPQNRVHAKQSLENNTKKPAFCVNRKDKLLWFYTKSGLWAFGFRAFIYLFFCLFAWTLPQPVTARVTHPTSFAVAISPAPRLWPTLIEQAICMLYGIW